MTSRCGRNLVVATLLAGLAWIAQGAAAIEVLLLWDDSPTTVPADHRPPFLEDLNVHTQDLVNALEDAGISVTFSREPQFDYDTDTPPLQDFDVVVHLNGDNDPDEFDEAISSGTAAAIEQYIRGGGGYIGAENNNIQMEALNITRLRAFTPIEYVAGQPPADGPQVITPLVSHPLFDGMGASFTINGTYIKSQLFTYSNNPAQLLAQDAAGNAAVAVRELQNGRIVGFYHRGNYQGPGQFASTLSDANVQKLYVNGVRWADKRPPRVASIELPAPAVNADDAYFIVHFTESVTGVDAGDFTAVPLAMDANGPITVTPLTSREYKVAVGGTSGSGLLHINLTDNNSIKDESVSANVLAGESGNNGDFTGPDLFVDTIPPGVASIAATPLGAGAGATPTIVIDFDDLMSTAVAPTIVLTTAANGALPLGAGAWTSTTRYEIPVGRVLTNNDAGLANIAITGAEDFVGNPMTPFNASPIFFPSVGLSASISPSGIVFQERGTSLTFSVSTSGVTGSVVYEWKKQSGSTVTTVGDDSDTLTLTDLADEDTGIYYCVVTDHVDTIETAHVQLRIIEALPAVSPWALVLLLCLIPVAMHRRAKILGQ